MRTLTEIINSYNYIVELDDRLIEQMEIMEVVPESMKRLHRVYGSAMQCKG